MTTDLLGDCHCGWELFSDDDRTTLCRGCDQPPADCRGCGNGPTPAASTRNAPGHRSSTSAAADDGSEPERSTVDAAGSEAEPGRQPTSTTAGPPSPAQHRRLSTSDIGGGEPGGRSVGLARAGRVVNPRLAARPTDPRRRLPVPFAQARNADGSANFALIDAQKAVLAGLARRCGLCGQPMGEQVAFLGGPSAVTGRAFLDPPMCVQCAEDATVLCPHLARQRVPRRPDDSPPPPGWTHDKPTRWGLYVTGAYGIVRHSSYYVFLPAPPTVIRWFTYHAGRLTEQPD